MSDPDRPIMAATAKPIVIATRGSALALAQAGLVLAQCEAVWPGQPFAIRIIKTTGDKMQSASLASSDLPKGLFTKELETALLAGEADMAVHSLKDLPTELPAGLALGAVLPRADVRDVLLYRHLEYLVTSADVRLPVRPDRRGFKPDLSLAALPFGAMLGTSSTRRAAQARECRPDLRIVPLRGNVGTRLRKLADQSELDAILLAAAGLDRLDFRILPGGVLSGQDVPPGLAATRLPLSEMLPCVGQGAIGLETRAGDAHIAGVCARLNDVATMACVTAERAFLAAMGGGCHLAVAAHAVMQGQDLHMRVVSFLEGGARRAGAVRPVNEAADLGKHLAGEIGGG